MVTEPKNNSFSGFSNKTILKDLNMNKPPVQPEENENK